MKWHGFLFTLALGVSVSACVPMIAGGAAAGVMGASMSYNNIGFDTEVTDNQLSLSIQSQIIDLPNIKKLANIQVVVFNHMVLLVGEVETTQLKDKIAHIAAKTKGAHEVFDQLKVGEMASLGDFTSDSWITTRVISDLNANGDNAFRYKVVTESGIVYLMARVSPAQGQKAAETASRVPGVRQVVKVF